MTPMRKGVVMTLLAVLASWHLYDVFAQTEHWPISPYPMYAKLQPNRYFRTVLLVGVTKKGQKEVELRSGYLRARMQVMRDEKITGEAATALLKDIYESINKARLAGADKTPELIGVRAYHYRWVMKWSGANKDQPDEVMLVGEYIKPQPATRSTTTKSTKVKKKKKAAKK